MQAKKDETLSNKNQISDLKIMLTTMNEAKSKELKNCGKASLVTVKRIMQQGSPARETGQTILDLICKFACANEQATFEREGTDIFETEATFSSAIKKCDPSKLERAFISQVADQVIQKVVPGDGKNALQQGAILR